MRVDGPSADGRVTEPARHLSEHACLSDREVMVLREQVDDLGAITVVGVDLRIWSVVAYAAAAVQVAGALLFPPHWPTLLAIVVVLAMGGFAEWASNRATNTSTHARWRLEDELARATDADMAWVRAYASLCPELNATLASWTADGRRVRERDVEAIRRYVRAEGTQRTR
ncbi:hypothetical protein RHOFW510R12_00450 [Rhodanobacter sp. FW510-R12]|uniref:hypothetical protein n=1 Tax=Rhodanobacter thiooxydans TaxID=416169 RepID=UPI000923188D|nr:hypothetical protein [Rhodanobacter thiooxydans]UJJ56711.1 hypothetical protein LRK53_19065 [Rhodanobacter thiooxydans]